MSVMTRREEHLEKVRRLRTWLQAHDYQAALLTSQNNFSWITSGGNAHVSLGEESAVASVLVAMDRVVLLTDVIEQPRLLDEELADFDMVPAIWPWHDGGGLKRNLLQFSDPAKTVVDRPGLGALRFDPRICEVRYALLPSEVERYRDMARASALAVETTCQEITPGMSELQVAALVARYSLEQRIAPLVNLVAADERIRLYQHPVPTERPVQKLFMVAMTGRRHGLHASITRFVAFGELGAETCRRHEAVVRVDAAYILGSRPGRGLDQVLEDGLSQYAAEGFADEWRLHH